MIHQIAVICNDGGCVNGSSSFTWRLVCSGSWTTNLGIGVISKEVLGTHYWGMFRATSWKGNLR